jgi:hypothetical protein
MSGALSRQGVVETTFDAGPPTSVNPAKVATLVFKGSLATLTSGTTEPAYLIVANKTADTLDVGHLTAAGPSFLSVSGGEKNISISPYGAALISLNIKANDSVRPGTQELVFQLPVRVGPHGTEFSLITAQQTEVAVEGESALLTALGVPALFLVPGFLLLATAGLLWRLRLWRLRSDGGEFPLKPLTPDFWLVAVSASLLLLVIWGALGIDLFGQYSRQDVVTVWGLSVAIGLLLYLVLLVPRYFWSLARVFTAADNPLKVLRKLDRLGRGLVLPIYQLPGETGQRYMLQEFNEQRPATWLAPAIELHLNNPSQILDDQITRDLAVTRDAGAFADTVARAGASASLSWADGSGPVLIEKEKIGTALATDLIVQKRD